MMMKIWNVVKKVLGVYCLLMVLGGVIATVQEKEPGLLALAAVFGLLAWLCFRRPKKKTQPEVIHTTETESLKPVFAEPVDAYIDDSGVTYRTDGQSIEDRELPYLMERDLQATLLERSSNPKFNRSANDEELIFKFISKHGDKSARLVSQFESLSDAAHKTEDLEEKIKFVTAALQSYQVAKNWHYRTSKGGMMYFQDMWEYMHNSKNPCFSWDEIEHEYLRDLVLERDKIRPAVLAGAEKGFLQKEFYAQVPPDKKSLVQHILKSMENEGLIIRVKKGGTYWVTTP